MRMAKDLERRFEVRVLCPEVLGERLADLQELRDAFEHMTNGR